MSPPPDARTRRTRWSTPFRGAAVLLLLLSGVPCYAAEKARTGDEARWCSVDGLVDSFGEFSFHGFQFTLQGHTHGGLVAISDAHVRWRPVAAGENGRREWVEGVTDNLGSISAPDVGAGSWEIEVCAAGYRPMHGTIVVDPTRPMFGETLVAIPAARAAADRVRVLAPSSVVAIEVGAPVRVKWRIENGPVDPKGWEIRVSILGCADGMGIEVIHAEPYRKAEGGFTWHATREVVDWIRANDDSGKTSGIEPSDNPAGDLLLPIMVCLYDAAGRGQPPSVLRYVEDEELAHLEACHPFGDPSWIVCGSTRDDEGKGRLTVTSTRPRGTPRKAPENWSANYEAMHPAVFHAGGGVSPARLLHRVDPDWKNVSIEERSVHEPILVEAVITPRGEILDPEILSTPRPTMDDQAREAVRQWRYEPARREGKPVAVFVTVEFAP